MALFNFISSATQAEALLPEQGLVSLVTVNGSGWGWRQNGPGDRSIDFAPALPAGLAVAITYVPVAAPAVASVVIADNTETNDPSQVLSAAAGFRLNNVVTTLQQAIAALQQAGVGGGSPAVLSGAIAGSAVVLNLTTAGLIGPFFLNVQPDAGCTVRVESSVDGGANFTTYADLTAAQTVLFDRAPGESTFANRIRLTRTTGSASDSRYSLGAVVAVVFNSTSGTTTPSDTTAPVRFSIAITQAEPDTVAITYNENLNTTAPASSAFTLGGTVVSGAKSFVSCVIAGNVVKVKYSSAFNGSDAPRFSYVVPGSNPIRDLAGNSAPAITNIAVANQLVIPAVAAKLNDMNSIVVSGDGFTRSQYWEYGALGLPVSAPDGQSWLISATDSGWCEMACLASYPSTQVMALKFSEGQNALSAVEDSNAFIVLFNNGTVTAKQGSTVVGSYTFPTLGAGSLVRLYRSQDAVPPGTVTMETSLNGGADWEVQFTFPATWTDVLYSYFQVNSPTYPMSGIKLQGFTWKGF